MRHRKAAHYAGISALALIFSLSVAPATLACDAEAAIDTEADPDQPASVSVTCYSGDTSRVFETRFGPTTDGETTIVDGYDGNGDDTVTLVGTFIGDGSETAPPDVDGTGVNLGEAGTLSTFGGDDRLDVTTGFGDGGPIPSIIMADIDLGAGDDEAVIAGDGTTVEDVNGGDGNDYIWVGIETIEDEGGEIVVYSNPTTGIISGDAGDDTIALASGTIDGADGGEGNDHLFAGQLVENDFVANVGPMSGGDGDDWLHAWYGANVSSMEGGDGNDDIRVGGSRNETTGAVEVFGGGRVGDIDAGGGDDTIVIVGTPNGVAVDGVVDTISAGAGNDRVTISGIVGSGEEPGFVDLGAGTDAFNLAGGTIYGSIFAGGGNDVVRILDGEVRGDVIGGTGIDGVTVSGGTITGDIFGETVTLSGGRIDGDIYGITRNTLIINDTLSPAALDLDDDVAFIGTNAVARITNTDLAAGGKTQNFFGFDLVELSGSTLRFGEGTPPDSGGAAALASSSVGTLTLLNSSTLYAEDDVTNISGSVNLNRSTLYMQNGVAGDVATLGGLRLVDSTIAIDVNQQTIRADRIIAGAFSASGVNTIDVNLVGDLSLTRQTDIPILQATNLPADAIFSFHSDQAGRLFRFEIIQAPGGGLILRATPIASAPEFVAIPIAATNSAATNLVVDTMERVNKDALEYDLELSGDARPAELSPTFGVFASGQFGAVQHDGFSVSGDNLVGLGPSFDATDFSAAISFDFNAAKHFEFDQQYGLNIGLYGGYASTNVDLAGFDFVDGAILQSISDAGAGDNSSAMFGSYVLARKGVDYALVSTSTFVGQSDIYNGVVGTSGSYDTTGYAVTAVGGHIFMLGDTAKFDLRGGLLGAWFTGDAYEDNDGNDYGESKISFGAVKFEPGIYADFPLASGAIFSPYARLDLQQRFGYRNTAVIDGANLDFDDADFSVAASTGFNLRVTDTTTVSGEVRGKFSSASNTVAGKLGLKVAF